MSSFVSTAPAALASVAADLSGVGSAIGAATAAAAPATTSVVPAAADEVSAVISALFGDYGQKFQALSAQVAGFHAQFVKALSAAGTAYSGTEAASGRSLLTELVNAAQPFGIFSPAQALAGRSLFVNGGAPGTVASPKPNRTVPLHEVDTGSSTRDVVNVSVNGGPTVPVIVDTGSNGLLVPITDIGLRHLGLPTGFHISGYGTNEAGQTEGILTFNAPINFGNGIVTAPTQVNVPLFTVVHVQVTVALPHVGPVSLALPYPDVPPFTHLLAGPGADGVLGVGPSATGPSPYPLLSALPAPLNQGVLINAPAGYLEFGPSPLPGGVSVPGSPISTLDVRINHGPLMPVATAIDSGGEYGTLPTSAVGHNTVPLDVTPVLSLGQTLPPGTEIQFYDPHTHALVAQTTTTATQSPQVGSEDLANTGNAPFLQEPVWIGNGPNSGSPGPGPFLPDRGTTIFYPGPG